MRRGTLSPKSVLRRVQELQRGEAGSPTAQGSPENVSNTHLIAAHLGLHDDACSSPQSAGGTSSSVASSRMAGNLLSPDSVRRKVKELMSGWSRTGEHVDPASPDQRAASGSPAHTLTRLQALQQSPPKEISQMTHCELEDEAAVVASASFQEIDEEEAGVIASIIMADQHGEDDPGKAVKKTDQLPTMGTTPAPAVEHNFWHGAQQEPLGPDDFEEFSLSDSPEQPGADPMAQLFSIGGSPVVPMPSLDEQVYMGIH